MSTTFRPRPPSMRSRVLAIVLAQTLRRWSDRAGATENDVRRIRSAADAKGSGRVPRGLEIRVVHHNGVEGRWIRRPGSRGDRGVLLYVHGGGFVFGSFRSHLPLVRRLQQETGFDVFFVDYRRAPEHPFPAAPDDVLAAYRYLLDDGVDPAALVVAGDSVGGQLIGSLLLDLAEHDLPAPAAAFMMSPALDLTASQALRLDAERPDPMLSPPYGVRLAQSYLAGRVPDVPQLQVIEAPKAGWPPVLITVGSTECMLGDAESLAASLRRDGVECELQVWPGQVHVFQGFGGLPEARASLRSAAEFLRARVPARPARPAPTGR